MQTILSSIATSTRAAAKPRSAPLDPQVADRLLDLLSTDDAFRRLFKRDPGKALERVGFEHTAGMPSPEVCFWGIGQLASKARIAEARDAIRSMLTSGLNQTTPNLDAGTDAVRRTRR